MLSKLDHIQYPILLNIQHALWLSLWVWGWGKCHWHPWNSLPTLATMFSSSVAIMVLSLSIFSLLVKYWKYQINMWGKNEDILYTLESKSPCLCHRYCENVQGPRNQDQLGGRLLELGQEGGTDVSGIFTLYMAEAPFKLAQAKMGINTYNWKVQE